MKNCPMCGHEYYDEATWCPDCEYDFPTNAPAAPPSEEEIASALERLACEEDPGAGPAASIAERIDALYRVADGDPNDLWKRSTEHLKHVGEYETAVRC